MIRTLIAGASLAVACLGCSDAEPPPAPNSEEPSESHVWQEQTETLDRARSVQDTLEEAEKARKAALDEDGGGQL